MQIHAHQTCMREYQLDVSNYIVGIKMNDLDYQFTMLQIHVTSIKWIMEFAMQEIKI